MGKWREGHASVAKMRNFEHTRAIAKRKKAYAEEEVAELLFIL